MSGSVRWYVYTSDNGVDYAILADKSNIAAVNPSGAAAPATLPQAAVPRNIKPRYALFSDDTGTIRRKVVLLKPSDVAALTPTLSFTPTGETAAVKLSSIKGEQIRLPKLLDTGRTN